MSIEERLDTSDETTLAAERAAEWLNRIDQAGERERTGFVKWLRRSPQNGGEILMAASTDLMLRHLLRNKRISSDQFVAASHQTVTPFGEEMRSQALARQQHRIRLIAGLGVGFAAVVAAFFVMPAFVHAWLHPHEYSTAIGEQRTISLPDGSVIAINARSTVRVAFSDRARDVYLERGQALFTVAKDRSKPFRVHVVSEDSEDAGGINKDTVIQAIGTKFDVRRRPDRINVAVIEGVVKIRSDAPSNSLDQSMKSMDEAARVGAGEAVNIQNTGIISAPTHVNIADVSAWQQRRLVFTDSTLEEIADEFARYNRKPRIRIEGNELRGQRLSGVFDADNPDALLMYLTSDGTIILDRKDDDLVIREHHSSGLPSPK